MKAKTCRNHADVLKAYKHWGGDSYSSDFSATWSTLHAGSKASPQNRPRKQDLDHTGSKPFGVFTWARKSTPALPSTLGGTF